MFTNFSLEQDLNLLLRILICEIVNMCLISFDLSALAV